MGGDSLRPSPALQLLGEAFRERRGGVLRVGSHEPPLRIVLREGHVEALAPALDPASPAAWQAETPLPRPDDSARIRLERVLAEIGIRPSATPKPRPPRTAEPVPPRETLLAALASADPASFAEGEPAPADSLPLAGPTEPLILEAVRRLDDAALGALLGDVEQRLVATTAIAEERTLTLSEGYLLSRIDGATTLREVLQVVPLAPEESERTLLGLLLTGRVECRPPLPRIVHRHETSEQPPPEPAADSAPPRDEDAAPEVVPQDDEPAQPAPPAPLDEETREKRLEIRELSESLRWRNHFEVLGLEPGCSDADVRRAYVALAKRFHPDAQRDPRLADLHDQLEEIFIRVGAAWEVLGEARSRAEYEAGLRPRRRAPAPEAPPVAKTPARGTPAARPAPASSATPPPPPAAPEPPAWVSPDETLANARYLISHGRYWDAIQVLEAAVPRMQPQRAQTRARILLARAYAKNPNWMRRAEETLQNVVREDPTSAEAHYELGLLYKAGGLAARAQAMFRRAVELRPEMREAQAELGPGDPAPGGLLKRLFGKGKAS
jgi:hypothetical protein